jgi:hypothetical protein
MLRRRKAEWKRGVDIVSLKIELRIFPSRQTSINAADHEWLLLRLGVFDRPSPYGCCTL